MGSAWGEFGMNRKWYISRQIEEALREAEPAADWLMRHPPGARLPDDLEPGYEPADYSECTSVPCDHWESKESPEFYGHCSHASCPNYQNLCSVHRRG